MFAGYTPTAKQAAIHRDNRARFVVISGAIRSGKSLCGSVEFVRRVLADISSGKAQPFASTGTFSKRCKPRLNYWVCAPTYLIGRETMNNVLSLVPEHLKVSWEEHTQTLWLGTPTGYVRISGRSTEDPHRLVAESVDGMLLDEAARMPAAAWDSSLRGRLLTSPGSWAVFATSPFSGKGNWVYRQIIAREAHDGTVAIHRLKADDNPVVDRAELVLMRAQLSERYARRDLDGDWAAFGEGVYSDEWDPAIHVVTANQIRLEYGVGKDGDLSALAEQAIGGVDWGWTAPSSLVVMIQTRREFLVVEDFEQAGMYVSDPRMSEGTLVAKANELRKRWGVTEWLCDSEDPRAISQFNSSGLNASRADKDRIDGARRVAGVLHVNPTTSRPRLRVLDTCKHVIDQVGRLSWKLDRDGNPVEGEFSDASPRHSADALRYAVMRATEYDGDGLPRVKVPVVIPGFGRTWGSRLA